MTEDVAQEQESPVTVVQHALPVRSIAPWWHTLLVVGMLEMWAVLARVTPHVDVKRVNSVTYVSMMMMQWVVLGAVVAGVYHRRSFFQETLERRARSWWIEVSRGSAVYVIGLVLTALIVVAFQKARITPDFDSSAFRSVVPQNRRDLLWWAIASLSTGFCEEHIFRGYLVQQMMALGRRLQLTRWVAMFVAVLVSSLIFGSLHLYEGWGGALTIGLLGTMYAVVVLRYGNLRAVMVAHALQDFLAMVFVMTRQSHGAN